jgi:hypothetical protein
MGLTDSLKIGSLNFQTKISSGLNSYELKEVEGDWKLFQNIYVRLDKETEKSELYSAPVDTKLLFQHYYPSFDFWNLLPKQRKLIYFECEFIPEQNIINYIHLMGNDDDYGGTLDIQKVIYDRSKKQNLEIEIKKELGLWKE